jgi:hypothetical protein
MTRQNILKAFLFVMFSSGIGVSFSHWAQASPAALDPAKIDQLTGLKGAMNDKEGVYKVSYPRTDLTVRVAGLKMTPGLGLTAWAAFQAKGDSIMAMGDMVLTEDQVSEVMDTALNSGLEVTALHNHFFWDSPKIMFMHIGGMGSQDELASAVGKVFSRIKETAGKKSALPRAQFDVIKSTIDTKKIAQTVGKEGELKDGVYKITIGRTIEMHGMKAGAAMGVNTWMAFAGNDQRAIIDGDFAMLESELQKVLHTLREAGIHVVAIHNHMTFENPRMMFLHFWGVGAPVVLAKGLKAALDEQGQ